MNQKKKKESTCTCAKWEPWGREVCVGGESVWIASSRATPPPTPHCSPEFQGLLLVVSWLVLRLCGSEIVFEE